MNLGGRLILSYVIIILITLTLSFFTLLVASRPIQNRLATAQLTAQSRNAARQIDQQVQAGTTIADIIRRINDSAVSNIRLVLADENGVALADSRRQWVGQPLAIADGQPGQTSPAEPVSGNLRDPSGQVALYAAQPVELADGQTIYIIALTPRERLLPRVIRNLGWGFVLAGVVALVVSLVVSIFIARTIALPLQRISRAAGAVAAGDYAQRVPESGPPEIKRVSHSFNVMARQVEISRQAMRDFVSNVSHELKTPLTSIKGFSQAIMEGAAPDESTRQRAASIIHEEADRMSRMVEDLLDLARIDSGQVVMQKTALDLSQILGSTVNRLLPQAAEKGIEINQNWTELPPIIGDGDRLAQVFTNLLDNAVRHTPPGGAVTISARTVQDVPLRRRVEPHLVQPDATTALARRGAMVEVSISDTGPGIPPADLARIFERFYQVDKSRKRGRGTGLGLAIIKEIVEAHSGAIGAESEEGLGTTFTITLPITEADAHTLISARR